MADPWTINVPLSALLALQELPEQMDALRSDVNQVRKELEALRIIQSQTLELFGDLKRAVKRLK